MLTPALLQHRPLGEKCGLETSEWTSGPGRHFDLGPKFLLVVFLGFYQSAFLDTNKLRAPRMLFMVMGQGAPCEVVSPAPATGKKQASGENENCQNKAI